MIDETAAHELVMMWRAEAHRLEHDNAGQYMVTVTAMLRAHATQLEEAIKPSSKFGVFMPNPRGGTQRSADLPQDFDTVEIAAAIANRIHPNWIRDGYYFIKPL